MKDAPLTGLQQIKRDVITVWDSILMAMRAPAKRGLCVKSMVRR